MLFMLTETYSILQFSARGLKNFHLCFICFAFNFSHIMTFVHCMGVAFYFGLLVSVRYVRYFVMLGFVMLGYCSMHFTVTLAGEKNIVCYTRDFVKSGFHC